MRGRLRQFREAGAQPAAADLTLAAEVLSPALLQLFLAQHPRDIVHGAATARWLMDRGEHDADLLIAALVHDVGKGAQRRRDRVAYVAAGWLGLAKRTGSEHSRIETRRAIARSLAHSASGAEVLRRAGASERAAALTLLHHAPAGDDRMLALLQQADAAS